MIDALEKKIERGAACAAYLAEDIGGITTGNGYFLLFNLYRNIIQVIIVGGRVGSPFTLRLTMLVRTSVSLLLNSFCLFSVLAVTSRSDSEAPKGH